VCPLTGWFTLSQLNLLRSRILHKFVQKSQEFLSIPRDSLNGQAQGQILRPPQLPAVTSVLKSAADYVGLEVETRNRILTVEERIHYDNAFAQVRSREYSLSRFDESLDTIRRDRQRVRNLMALDRQNTVQGRSRSSQPAGGDLSDGSDGGDSDNMPSQKRGKGKQARFALVATRSSTPSAKSRREDCLSVESLLAPPTQMVHDDGGSGLLELSFSSLADAALAAEPTRRPSTRSRRGKESATAAVTLPFISLDDHDDNNYNADVVSEVGPGQFDNTSQATVEAMRLLDERDEEDTDDSQGEYDDDVQLGDMDDDYENYSDEGDNYADDDNSDEGDLHQYVDKGHRIPDGPIEEDAFKVSREYSGYMSEFVGSASVPPLPDKSLSVPQPKQRKTK
jgi:hypothetical protein